MKRYSVTLVLILLCLVQSKTAVFAQSASNSADVSVQVSVNGYFLNLSGYLAPYASITLTSNGNVFASTTADPLGNFAFSSIRVAKGFTSFCLDGVDFKRLGESEACFSIPPVNGASTKSGIFLPPTIGVFRTNVNVGNNALVFGYGMPNALIHIKLDKNIICDKTADKGGYYECNFPIQNEGNHEVYADSQLNNQSSEPQLKRVLIKGISLIKVTPIPAAGRLPNFFYGLPGILVGLFVGLLLIILLIILIRKFNPSWLPRVFIPNPEEVMHHAFDSFFRERKLHHWWMEGVGY